MLQRQKGRHAGDVRALDVRDGANVRLLDTAPLEGNAVEQACASMRRPNRREAERHKHAVRLVHACARYHRCQWFIFFLFWCQ